MNFKVKNESLAAQGALKLDWAREHMPVLAKIREYFKKTKPLAGKRIAACLHVTKETGILMEVLREGGASVALCASNPLSTQDDVAAALAKQGVSVYAWRGVTNEEYYWCLEQIADTKPHITIDDGADLINLLHTKRRDLLKDVLGGQEETTTGVIRLKALAREGKLEYPLVAVNDTPTKHFFDNRYGTGSSTLDGIMRATNILLAGKTFVVAGYGWCWKGVGMRARGMGANVVVTEIDALKALEAKMDGFIVMPMEQAAKVGDVFCTATGCKDVITREHFKIMKNGAILCNTGHFDSEINVKQLRELAGKNVRLMRDNNEEYVLGGKKLYLLAEGRLVNLAAAEGHPAEVMDQSFANQALVAEYLAANAGGLDKKVYEVPQEIDAKIASIKLESMGVQIDRLTPEQEKYLQSWQEGT